MNPSPLKLNQNYLKSQYAITIKTTYDILI